ncbi:MAG: hypothetical protein DCF28_11860 [Alphaproteobacteria bacterium]|nr:MAG: hypothetical protein DCF28_11860 [Alphaproteobacteria bacterium]PZO40917.1 MAG: hypothetical protein DCE92_01780 [Alphaproteobacteria bacterium]
MIVNDEVVQRGSSFIRQDFSAPWLTMVGEEELRIVMTSRLAGIHCEARLAGDRIEPFAYKIATWKGDRSSWPPEDGWMLAGERSWIVR